jgi:hypothetical protein
VRGRANHDLTAANFNNLLGCRALKLESFKISSAKPQGTPLKPALSNLGAASNLAAAASKPATPAPAAGQISGEQRRKSQRVLLRVRANIHVALQGKPATIEATTLSVYNQGAMIVVRQSLPQETKLVLENVGTKERVPCRVAKASREMPEGFHIPVEFDSPAPNFWGIAFPPVDWKPHDDL